MPTATAEPTTTDLESRLDGAQEELEAAQRDLGATELDGNSSAAAAKRLATAMANLERLQAAAAEQQHRDNDRQAAEAATALARNSAHAYERMSEWLTLAEHVARTDQAARAARAKLRGFGTVRGGLKLGLDEKLSKTTNVAVGKPAEIPAPFGPTRTAFADPAFFAALRERAKQLAAEQTELAESLTRG